MDSLALWRCASSTICRLSEVVNQAGKKKIPSYVRSVVLEICCTNSNDEDVDTPYVKYTFR